METWLSWASEKGTCTEELRGSMATHRAHSSQAIVLTSIPGLRYSPVAECSSSSKQKKMRWKGGGLERKEGRMEGGKREGGRLVG